MDKPNPVKRYHVAVAFHSLPDHSTVELIMDEIESLSHAGAKDTAEEIVLHHNPKAIILAITSMETE